MISAALLCRCTNIEIGASGIFSYLVVETLDPRGFIYKLNKSYIFALEMLAAHYDNLLFYYFT